MHPRFSCGRVALTFHWTYLVRLLLELTLGDVIRSVVAIGVWFLGVDCDQSFFLDKGEGLTEARGHRSRAEGQAGAASRWLLVYGVLRCVASRRDHSEVHTAAGAMLYAGVSR